MQDFGWLVDFSFPKSWIHDSGNSKILAFQNPKFKFLPCLKILAFQDFEFTIWADFKILPLQNPQFKILNDFKI